MYSEIQSEFSRQMMQVEDDCLRGILEQLVPKGDVVIAEHGKLLTLVYNEAHSNSYLVVYSNVVLGMVTKSLDYKTMKYTCVFNPAIKTFK